MVKELIVRQSEKVPYWVTRFTASLSTIGLLFGTLFLAASLTPSLLPRTFLMQGLVSGFSLICGYGIGVSASWLWGYLELPLPPARVQRIILYVAAVFCVAAAASFLWQANAWQNDLRALMGLEPVGTENPLRVGGIATLIFVAVLALARLFHVTFRFITHKLHRFIPWRVANVVGILLAVVLFWSVIDGVLFQYALRVADASHRQVDALVDPDEDIPGDELKTGSSASLLAWEELGRRGREFVSTGPSAEELAAFLEEEGMEPIRVYVGLNSAETIEERAQLALDELVRVGAFERSALVIVTPTGTGWVDPGAMDAIEYLKRGDIASVAVQYSYLPSWLSLLVEAEYGAETAKAVFAKIYEYWTRLPRDGRPELYLHGLSLGALNSDRAADLYDIIADPFSGALWSGAPYRSTSWRTLTAARRSDSPAWLPRFRDGSVVRFTNQEERLDIPGATWGPVRIVYLQYASDPITFFESQALYRQPEWMDPPRGPDVSDRLRWFPVVTMLQLAVDMAAADSAPVGFGHVYAPEHYVRAWREVANPEGWSDASIERLKRHLSERRASPPAT